MTQRQSARGTEPDRVRERETQREEKRLRERNGERQRESTLIIRGSTRVLLRSSTFFEEP